MKSLSLYLYNTLKHIVMNTTIDLNAYRDQLLQDISHVDNLEVLESIRRAYRRALNKLKKEEKEAETLTPYTMEELHARIDRSLADAKAGRVYTNEEMNRFMQEYIEECHK